jgi:CarD family transcriptional regulator, regulator of rRNA transcription
MRLRVGDVVVYAAYGVGRISAREARVVGGEKRDTVVLELSDGLTVSLPIELAREQLREVSSEAQLRAVQNTLRQEPTTSSKPWIARQRDIQTKLSNGDALGLAEIVRDSAPRPSPADARKGKSQSATGEQRVFLKARKLLSSEIAQARGLDAAAAEEWIESQLAHA